AALVGEHGHEYRRVPVQVDLLLGQPPGVFDPPVVVVARPDPIHPGHVEAIAPDLLEPAVLIAVARQLRVAVELAAQGLVRLPADGRSVAPDAPDLLELVRVDRRGGAVSSGARAAERR